MQSTLVRVGLLAGLITPSAWAGDSTYSSLVPSVVCVRDDVRVRTPPRFFLHVVDVQGQALDGAAVTLSSNKRTHEGKTDLEGRWLLPALEPGKYTLTVALLGFREARVLGVVAERGCINALLVPLELVDVTN